jgi:hypothetical protein
LGQCLAQARPFGGVEVLEELVLHGPDVSLGGGVAGLAGLGQRDDPGAAVGRIGGAGDQAVALELVKQSDQSRLVVPELPGRSSCASGRSEQRSWR